MYYITHNLILICKITVTFDLYQTNIQNIKNSNTTILFSYIYTYVSSNWVQVTKGARQQLPFCFTKQMV